MTTTISYGYTELQYVYQRNFLIALLSAILLVAGTISAYRMTVTLLTREHRTSLPTRVIDLKHWNPSISHTALPNIRFGSTMIRPSFGVPVPVPDAEANPDITFGLPDDPLRNNMALTDSGDGGGLTGLWIDEPIPDPGKFIAREMDPLPITTPTPPYPEIARRIMLEGAAWVKVYVDQEGVVRKAIILKSDAEIFNEPALEAARKWTFRPALMNNRPVGVWVAIPFRFRLN